MGKSTFLIFVFLGLFFEDVTSRKHHHHHHQLQDDHRIVGGYNTTIQDAPYQVYLILQKGTDYYECGGSIISETYVLSAAHCITGSSSVFVRAGSTNKDSGGTQYNTTSFIMHPLYNPVTFDYDVALVNIPGGITLDGTNSRAVQLPRAGRAIQPGTNILVTGWGDTTENGQDSETLMAVQVPTISNTNCRNSYVTLTARQFCAGLPEGGKDSCQGDSGGPAVGSDSGLQLGIVSFGEGCARPGYPGVYTNVARVRRWIRMNSGV